MPHRPHFTIFVTHRSTQTRYRMNHRLPVQVLFSSALFFAALGGASAQCTNLSPYPPNATIATADGQATTITECNFQTEYATITGVIAGASYEFTMAGGAWVTVHQGTSNGPVLGYGASPLTVEAATAQNMFVHWNTDSLCGTAQDCHTTTVRLLAGGCTPPEVVTEVVPDCANNQFTVQVDVVNTGDATSVGLSWTVNGGTANTLTGLQAGTYELGPFTNLSLIDLIVIHAEQPACSVVVVDLTSSPCSILSCGPDTYTFCYGNNENIVRTYQGTSTYPLRLQFNSGSVSGSGNDALVIHDGLLPTDPVLFSGVGNAGNLTGVTALSTNPDHALTLTFTSNSSFSCADGGGLTPWNYTVVCLDCEAPAGVAGPVSTDCEAQEFTVAVNVTDLGTADSVLIANNAGEPWTTVLAAGQFIAGPFAVGTPVQLSLVNPESAICTVQLGTFENGFCPLQITCGEPALDQTYCYQDSDTHSWLYTNTGTESLAILFSGGSIESATFDHLTIYDGDDDTAPVLYNHILGSTEQLTNLLVISTGPSLYMEMSSDNSVSCGSGSQSQWFWTVGCLDCEQPEATWAVVLDCENSQFSIAAEITALGSDPSITVTNTGGAATIEVTEVGTYNVGPFALGADVQVNLVVENSLCSVHSPVLTSAPCPLIGCGPYQFDLCYPNNMDTTVVYQSSSAFPIAVIFNTGGLMVNGDLIQVYDGPDFQAPLIFSGSNGGDLSGLEFVSTNPDNALCLRFVSDGFTSCASGGVTVPWNWSVSCLDCTNPAATFELEEDCLHHGFNVAVNVSSLGSASDLRITDSWSGDTLSGVGLGTTMIGPIPVGQSAQITLLNSVNPLCRINSESFFLPQDQCVVTACEPLGVDYCYANADTAWFTYQSGENTPVTVAFASGQILEGDEVWVYNGLDDEAQLVFAGDFGGDISGFSISSSNPDNALTFQVISDGEGSCSTGEAATHISWTVGCGLVGMDEEQPVGALLFPQPCSDDLNVRWPGMRDASVMAELFDITGRCVLHEGYRAVPSAVRTLDVEHLPAGGYVVRLTSAHGVFSGQVVIQR